MLKHGYSTFRRSVGEWLFSAVVWHSHLLQDLMDCVRSGRNVGYGTEQHRLSFLTLVITVVRHFRVGITPEYDDGRREMVKWVSESYDANCLPSQRRF